MKRIITFCTILVIMNLYFTELVFGMHHVIPTLDQTLETETSDSAQGSTHCDPYYETVQEVISIDENCILSVHNYQGNVRVVGWDKDYVLVKASKYSYRCRKELDQISLSYMNQSDLLLEMKPDKKNLQVKVNLTIYVPKTVTMGDITTTNGEVLISKLSKEVEENVIITKY